MSNPTAMPDGQRSETFIQALVDSLPNGVLAIDSDGRLHMINPAGRRMLGLAEHQPSLSPLSAWFDDHGLNAMIRSLLADPGTQNGGRQEACEFSAGERFLMANGRALPDGGVIVTLTDITAVKVLERLKNEFVAKVSHELRSPLSTIHEQLAVVLNDLAGQISSSDEHLLSRAKEKTGGLIDLIGDLMDLSRIEAGVVCQSPKPLAIEDLLENIIDFLGIKAAAKRQSLKLVRATGTVPLLHLDPLALESIFGNLITNAINYTPEGGAIELRLEAEADCIRVHVSDTGFGIEPRHLDKIFERFYRVKNEKTRSITGTGLGLPIVKGLVETLSGSLRVQSTPGKGSTFSVTLPVA